MGNVQSHAAREALKKARKAKRIPRKMLRERGMTEPEKITPCGCKASQTGGLLD